MTRASGAFHGQWSAGRGFLQRRSGSEASFYRWRKQLKGPAATPVRAARFIDAGALAMAEGSSAAAVQERPPEPNLEVCLDLGHGLVLHIVRR